MTNLYTMVLDSIKYPTVQGLNLSIKVWGVSSLSLLGGLQVYACNFRVNSQQNGKLHKHFLQTVTGFVWRLANTARNSESRTRYIGVLFWCQTVTPRFVDRARNKCSTPMVFLFSETWQNGNTPLHVACREGHIFVAQVLVEHGASLQAKNKVRGRKFKNCCSGRFLSRARLVYVYASALQLISL